MAGIRIRHEDRTSCTFTLVDGSRPYLQPVICLLCAREHTFKTYHITLDAEGCSIVSDTVWERLSSLPRSGGFELVNEVEKPPQLIIGLGDAPGNGLPLVVSEEFKEPN